MDNLTFTTCSIFAQDVQTNLRCCWHLVQMDESIVVNNSVARFIVPDWGI